MSSVIVTDNSLTAWSSHTCSHVCGVGGVGGCVCTDAGLMIECLFGCWVGGWCFLAGSDAGLAGWFAL